MKASRIDQVRRRMMSVLVLAVMWFGVSNSLSILSEVRGQTGIGGGNDQTCIACTGAACWAFGTECWVVDSDCQTVPKGTGDCIKVSGGCGDLLFWDPKTNDCIIDIGDCGGFKCL